MGCCGSKKRKKQHIEEEEEMEDKTGKGDQGYGKKTLTINEAPKKMYSWDAPREVDPAQYTVSNLNDELVIKGDGVIDGQQFIIQNCEHSTIVLLDYSDTITVDNCSGCRFIIGPVGGSIFFRNCEGCSCAVACQQFRTRDCDELNIFLHCTTQPVIESSRNMRFMPLRMNYTHLLEHYRKANLSLFDNHWDNIHDFTPNDYDRNYTTIARSIDPVQVFKFRENELLGKGDNDTCAITDAKLSFTEDDCLLPLVTGETGKSDETAVVILFHHQLMTEEMMLDILHRLSRLVTLVMTRHFDFGSEEACRVFIDDSPESIACRKAATAGRMVGAEYNGENAIAIVQGVVAEYLNGIPGSGGQTLAYTSPNDVDTNHVLGILNTLHSNRFDY